MVKMLKTVLNTDKTALAKNFKFSEFCRNYKIVTNIFGYFDEEFNLFFYYYSALRLSLSFGSSHFL